jgi:hypothetical protein
MCQFDSQPLKVNNCFDLRVCKGRVTLWERFQQGLQLHFKLHVNRKFPQEVMGPKWWEFQFQKFRDSQLGNLGKNTI